MTTARRESALSDLTALVAYGIRFHGSAQIDYASKWIESQLMRAGLRVQRQPVSLPGWEPGSVTELTVLDPIERVIPAWPMLWSGRTDGVVVGTLSAIGVQGLWGDSMTWRKFAVINSDGLVAAYLHARDDGPAAPQPLPSGSDHSKAHFAIGRLDGLQLTEWLSDEKAVVVRVNLDSSAADTAVSDNLIVDIGDFSAGGVLICAHYDTFYNTVGAYDNGSGTIALVQLAALLGNNGSGRAVRLVFFTAEEWHLGGSRHYVSSLAAEELSAIDYVINIDGLGRGDFMESFCSPESFELDFLSKLADYSHRTRPALRTISRFPPTRGTDDASFYSVGVPTIFMTFNDLHRLHQPDDIPNLEIAGNIIWTTDFVAHLVESLRAPVHSLPPGIL